MSSPFTLLLLVFFLFSSPAIAGKCNKDDKKALREIKNQVNNPYTIISWTSDSACCDWPGVACDVNDRVYDLFLDNLESTFTIPSAVTKLPFLTTLQFHKNPGLIGQIPSFIGDIKTLTFLRLDWNNLTGPVPDFLSRLTNLEYLNLAFNKLSGSLPPSLGTMPALQYIRIDRNQLTGSIPASLGTSPATYLLLGHNSLTGTIPETFASNNYGSIDLSRNKLTGDASVLFGKSKPVTNLDLSRNLFEFDMSKIKFPENMTTLDINHNKIYGTLPPELGMFEWQFLNVSYNRLCGPIPVGEFIQSRFDQYSFFHNKCLCGAPLPPCK